MIGAMATGARTARARSDVPRALGAVMLVLGAIAAGSTGTQAASAPAGADVPAKKTKGLVVSVHARALRPGEAVRILVGRDPLGTVKGAPSGDATPAAGLARVTGTFLGETLSFAPSGSTGEWSAWAVVGVEEKPGTKPLAIDAKDEEGHDLRVSRDVRIAAKSFPTEKLTVKEQYVEPPPEVAERIASETKRLAALYATRTPSALAGVPFVRPVPGEPLGTFGARRILNGKPRSPHPGLDLRAGTGTPVMAAGPGRVVLASELYFSGNTVIVDHGEGLFTLYAHLSRIDVREGDAVARGAQVGLSGATGRVTGPHLHWGAKVGDRPFDPTALLDRRLFE
jgi:murein DD-endopeptidase MepM/ murein hydrolase activator NlpD